ncbi:MAG: ATP phosphoribosyltransferase [Lachnospiraceae bacterium]|nr:ATP phosphoribosyltransferase [Lachnospiraceae bacterium]
MPGVGDCVAKGGRYDNLLKEFGKDAPAIGFVIVIDDLLQAVRAHESKERDEYLTFALTKGRLADKTLQLLEQIGISCDEVRDKETRKLVFVNDELKLRFFLAKGPDVPTYVENGVADIGVVGEDTILEENRRVYEVMDLGFGKCRMCVCGPKEAGELLKHHEKIRVCTKYPTIARDYFYNKKHQTVELIKLNGSVELGPIVGLGDVIVDIVETGSTLRENGLEILEEILPLSARMIVNQVSMQLKSERIRNIISSIKEL